MAEKPLVVRHKVNGHTFEALVHAHKVTDYRQGKAKLGDVLVDDENVYKDHAKGLRWGLKELAADFETDKIADILKIIIEKGKAQVSHDEMKEEHDKKIREMINYVHKEYVDGKGAVIPVTRIESAFENLKGWSVDVKRSAATQVQEIERRLIDTGLSMKKHEMEGTITLPTAHVATAQGVVRKFCTVRDTKYNADGAVFSVSLVPGAFDEMLSALGAVTKGDFSFDMVG